MPAMPTPPALRPVAPGRETGPATRDGEPPERFAGRDAGRDAGRLAEDDGRDAGREADREGWE
jgi:hypothetical protein